MKKIILLMLVLSVLVLAACSKPEIGTTGGDDAAQSGDESFAGSLANAMKLGKSFKCSSTDQDGNKVDLYVKGEKFRSEGTIQGMKSYTIMDENKCMWTWQEENNQGIKLCVPKGQEKTAQSTPAQAPQGQVKTDINVDCKATSVSDSMFTQPNNVQFTDLQETLDKAMASVPSEVEIPSVDTENIPGSGDY